MVEIDWGRLALYSLGLYIPLAPFEYKRARDERNLRVAAITRMLLLYVLVFLWIVGGAFALYGLGMVFDRPDEPCGIGCIEPASGHWGSPTFSFLLLGLAFMVAAWWLGRAMEQFQGWLSARAAKDPKRNMPSEPFDFEKYRETEEKIKELSEALTRGEMPIPPYVPTEIHKKKALWHKTDK